MISYFELASYTLIAYSFFTSIKDMLAEKIIIWKFYFKLKNVILKNFECYKEQEINLKVILILLEIEI